jgi:hypothetical protein
MSQERSTVQVICCIEYQQIVEMDSEHPEIEWAKDRIEEHRPNNLLY